MGVLTSAGRSGGRARAGWLAAVAGFVLAGLVSAFPARADDALLRERCGACHASTEAGPSRIAGQRKSPEGWMMTIVRMQQIHGVPIEAGERRRLVQYLSDTQGLAPAETEGWRYAFEKDPNVVEAVQPPLDQMCARCHTGARVALQRRTAEEWLLHMDFHVGQFPTVEYQALGRDRPWYEIARNEIAPLLAQRYPLETEAWSAWSAAQHRPPTGEWIVLFDLPESGQAFGRLRVGGDASPFRLSGRITMPDGREVPATGSMNLYTGFEWRANLAIGGRVYRQVLAMSEDGTRLEGRQFVRDQDSLGGRLTGARLDAGPVLLGLAPAAVAAGGARVQAVGVGLGDLSVDAEGATVEPDANGARVHLHRTGNGWVTFTAGPLQARLAVYESLDRLAVEPDFAIARVGGGSERGPLPVPAHFRAIGYWNGPDGEPGSGDDVRVGEVDARWNIAPHNEAAEAMQDDRFAGRIGADGVFTPAVAGPNPQRPFSTNNAGDLRVEAEHGGRRAHARLVVTVQRFVDPPLR